MLAKIHPIAGVIGFLTILTFWTSTAYSEVFGTHETIAAIKAMILNGMFILIPAMVIVGASGMSIGRRRKDAPARAKKNECLLLRRTGFLSCYLRRSIWKRKQAPEYSTHRFMLCKCSK